MSLRRKSCNPSLPEPAHERPLYVTRLAEAGPHELLPELHGHQSKAMADLSFAMTARPALPGRQARRGPARATPTGQRRQRRVERFLANDRIDPLEGLAQMARARSWPTGPAGRSC